MATSADMAGPSTVLAKATFRAALRLKIPEEQLVSILGADAFKADAFEPSGSPGRRGLQLIRIYRCLSALTGDDSAAMAHWMVTGNERFKCSPRQRILTAQGLEDVASYLAWVSRA